jgi:hypothetical protein
VTRGVSPRGRVAGDPGVTMLLQLSKSWCPDW